MNEADVYYYTAVIEILLYTFIFSYIIVHVFWNRYKIEVASNMTEYRNNPAYAITSNLFGQDSNTVFGGIITNLVKNVFGEFIKLLNPIFNIFEKLFSETILSINKIRNSLLPIRYFMSNAAMTFYNEMDKSDRVITYSMNKTRDSMKRTLSGFNLLYHTMEHNKNTLESIVNSPILGLVQKFIGPVNWIASKANKLCFDENTTLYLQNNETVSIMNIRVGDILIDGSVVIAKHKFKNDIPLYLYNTVYVSGSHIVYDNNSNKWIKINECGIITNYKPEYIYSISTSTSKIQLKYNLYRDYAESQSIERNSDIDNFILYYLN